MHQKKWKIASCLALLVVVLLFIKGLSDQKGNVEKKIISEDKIMIQQTTYPTNFAGPGRACAIPVLSKSQGHITWSCELNLTEESRPDFLLIWEGHAVVATHQAMLVYSKDGKLLWERTRIPGSLPAILNELLYYENDLRELDAVDLSNKPVIDSVFIPAVMNSQFAVKLLWPREKDFLAVVYWPGHLFNQKPNISWSISTYGERIEDSGDEYKEMMKLNPLFIPALHRLVISTRDVICIDIQQGNELPRFKIPMTELVDWSADTEGTLCIIGYEGENKVMVAMSLTGQEKWRWVDSEKDDRWVTAQPPIRSGDQRVYALAGSRVLAIELGNLLWQYEVKYGTLRHGSSLADRSLLVTAGKTLIHLDSAGNERFMVSLEDEILTPPVVDADGNIYVATATHLVQIK